MTGHPSTIPADVLDIIATMRETGAKFKTIEQATGIHRKTCEYHAVRLGALPPAGARRCPPPARYARAGAVVRAFTVLEDQQIIAWSVADISLSEIGRRLGRKHNSILGRLRTLARREAMAEAAA